MTLANTQKNEVLIQLGSKEFLTRPTFNFICQIEDYFNQSLRELGNSGVVNGNMKAAEMVVIIAAGIEAAGGKVDKEEIQQAIVDAGTSGALIEVGRLIMAAFSGPKINVPEDTKKK